MHIETCTKIKVRELLIGLCVMFGCIYPQCCLSARALKRLGLGFKGFKRHVNSLHEPVAPEQHLKLKVRNCNCWKINNQRFTLKIVNKPFIIISMSNSVNYIFHSIQHPYVVSSE